MARVLGAVLLVSATAGAWASPVLAQDGSAGAAAFDPALVLMANVRSGSVSDRYLANLLASFRAMDTDANGLDEGDLARIELRNLDRAQAASAARRKEAEEALARMDTDADGGISPAELGVALEREASGRDKIEREFRQMDRNGDGLVQLGEVPGSDSPGRRQDFGRIDSDGDGGISSSEFLAQSAPRSREALPVAPEFAKRDRDGDGLISIDELADARSAGPSESPATRRRKDRFAHVLAIDPDGDGRLSEAELTESFHRQFSRIDRDGDAAVSPTEAKLAEPLVARAGVLLEAPVCPVPAPGDGALRVAFAARHGQLLSTVAVGSQDQITSIVDVAIEAGASSVYLIVVSIDPVIWRLSGDVSRVERIAVFAAEGDPAVGAFAAVAGVAPDRVFFGHPGCLPAHRVVSGRPGSDDDLAALIAATTGVVGEARSVTGGAGSVAIPSLAVHRVRGSLPAPHGFDPDIWWDAVGTWPRGLASPTPASLVSPVPVVDYEVLPGQMGPARLVAEGVLEPTDNFAEYRIVRPLSRFPGGMTGGHASSFVLPAGMAMPAGDQGHGCVYSEAGEIIGRNTSCRRSPRGDALIVRQREDGRRCLYSYGGREESCFPEDGGALQVVETERGRELRPVEPGETDRAPIAVPPPITIVRTPVEIIPAGLRQTW